MKLTKILFLTSLTLATSLVSAAPLISAKEAALPAASGASSILTNIGTLRNQGIELALNGTIAQNKNFKWEATINMAKNINKVENISEYDKSN